MITTLRNIDTKGLEFLLTLDRRLHRIQQLAFTSNMIGYPFEVLIDTCTIHL